MTNRPRISGFPLSSRVKWLKKPRSPFGRPNAKLPRPKTNYVHMENHREVFLYRPAESSGLRRRLKQTEIHGPWHLRSTVALGENLSGYTRTTSVDRKP